MDTIPVAAHPLLSATCTVPSTDPVHLSMIRSTSSAVNNAAMSDTATKPFAGGQSSLHGMQFANQLRTSSPSIPESRFQLAQPLSTLMPQQQRMSAQSLYPSASLYAAGQLTAPMNVVSTVASVPVPAKPVVQSIPYFVASRLPPPFSTTQALAAGYFRSSEAFIASKQQQPQQQQQPTGNKPEQSTRP